MTKKNTDLFMEIHSSTEEENNPGGATVLILTEN